MADNGNFLVLRLDGQEAASLGAVARMSFGAAGGTIGSGQDCEWVLRDPQGAVEGHHARIMSVAGHYFMADTSSKGVFVADDVQPLGPGASTQLAIGDRLRIGPYRIVVEQAPDASAAAPGSTPSASVPDPPGGSPGPETLLTPPNTAPASSEQGPSSAAKGGDANGSTLSDEWEQHLASLLGPLPPTATETRGDGPNGASQTAQAPGLAQLAPASSGSFPSASGLLVADPAHGPLTALLTETSGVRTQAPPPLPDSWATAGASASPRASPIAEQRQATSSGPTPSPGQQASTGSANRVDATTTSSLITLGGQEVSPWDISRHETGPPKTLGDGVLRGLGLALPSLSDEQMGALGYDLGRGLSALADLLVEFVQKEGAPPEQEARQAEPDPFATSPTGVQALAELITARRAGGSIEGAVRASIQRLRQRLDARHEHKRRLFESALSGLQERHALRTALAQLEPQRLAGNYGLGNSNRRRIKARAWDMFKANYPQIVELALARGQRDTDGLAGFSDDAGDTGWALNAWSERGR